MKKAILLSTVVCMFISSFTFSDNIFVSCRDKGGQIIEIDSSGKKSVFASNLGDNDPSGMAFDNSGNLIVNDDLRDLHIKIEESEEFDYLKEQKIFKMKFSQIKNKIFIPIYYTGVERT